LGILATFFLVGSTVPIQLTFLCVLSVLCGFTELAREGFYETAKRAKDAKETQRVTLLLFIFFTDIRSGFAAADICSRVPDLISDSKQQQKNLI